MPSSISISSNDTLSLYWDLASKDVDIRTRAAATLIRQLVAVQSEWSAARTIHMPTNDDPHGIETLCAPDVSYALKRLLRGLASSRAGARQGFSVALTELLTIIPELRLSHLMHLLLTSIEVTGSMKSQEERDGYFGRIFGILAFTLSGVLARPTTTIQDIQILVSELVKYQRAKSYLRECCAGVLISVSEALSNTDLEEPVIEYILSTILIPEGINNPEQLWLAIVLQNKYPRLPVWKTLTSSTDHSSAWQKPWLLHPSNRERLAEILKESSYSNPKLHGVWNVIIHAVLSANKGVKEKSKRKVISLLEFWQLVLDTMFSSTPERKYVVYELFKVLLPRLNPTQIPVVLNRIFIRQLMRDLSDSKGLLFDSAKLAAKVFAVVAKQNEEASYHLVLQLIGQRGIHEFDKVTKTKTVASMMESMSADGFQKYVEYLKNTFLNQPVTIPVEEVDSNRSIILDQMTQLVRTAKIPKSEEGLWIILQFLAAYGLCNTASDSCEGKEEASVRTATPPLSSAAQQSCRLRLFTVLGDLNALSLSHEAKNDDDGIGASGRRKNTGIRPSSGNTWAYDLNMWIETLSRTYSLELDEESAQVRKNVLEIVKSIRKKVQKLDAEEDKATQSKYHAFEMLLLHAVLQLYLEPQQAKDTLNELQDCYARVFETPKVTNTIKGLPAGNDGHEEGPQPIDVLIDILLSFLARPSVLLRAIAEQAFAVFARDLTKTGLNVIFEVLTSRSGLAGAKDLFETVDDDDVNEPDDNDNDDESVIEDADENNEDDGDVVMEDDIEDSENDQSDDDEAENADPELQAKADEEAEMLRLAIQSALAGTKHAAPIDDDEAGDDDDGEELLGDDEMEEFDDKLAEIFTQRRAQKAEAKDAKQNVLHFKLRVLTLLEIYIKKQCTNPLILSIFLPLLRTLASTSEDSDSHPIHNKIVSLLKRHVFKLRKYPAGVHVVNECVRVMREVHEFMGKVRERKVISELSSGVCMVLIRILNHQPAAGGAEGVCIESATKMELNENITAGGKACAGSNSRKSNRKKTSSNDCDVSATVGNETTPKANAMALQLVIDLYASTLQKYMTSKRSHINPLIFMDLINRYPDLAWKAFPMEVIKYLSIESVPRSFQMVQAYAILARLFTQLSNQREDEFKNEVATIISAIAKGLLSNSKSIGSNVEESNQSRGITATRWKDILASVRIIERRTKTNFDSVQ
ncbi:hypothetical protein SeMB42_g06860 [Synchytrium endobioticum]|nr:hypothetical protein SeMB42_g06860 [Synchytrium endobioticum]